MNTSPVESLRSRNMFFVILILLLILPTLTLTALGGLAVLSSALLKTVGYTINYQSFAFEVFLPVCYGCLLFIFIRNLESDYISMGDIRDKSWLVMLPIILLLALLQIVIFLLLLPQFVNCDTTLWYIYALEALTLGLIYGIVYGLLFGKYIVPKLRHTFALSRWAMSLSLFCIATFNFFFATFVPVSIIASLSSLAGLFLATRHNKPLYLVPLFFTIYSVSFFFTRSQITSTIIETTGSHIALAASVVVGINLCSLLLFWLINKFLDSQDVLIFYQSSKDYSHSSDT